MEVFLRPGRVTRLLDRFPTESEKGFALFADAHLSRVVLLMGTGYFGQKWMFGEGFGELGRQFSLQYDW